MYIEAEMYLKVWRVNFLACPTRAASNAVFIGYRLQLLHVISPINRLIRHYPNEVYSEAVLMERIARRGVAYYLAGQRPALCVSVELLRKSSITLRYTEGYRKHLLTLFDERLKYALCLGVQ